MVDIKSFRREWSTNHKILREMLKSGTDLERAIDLFYKQHAALHSQIMSGMNGWSYADEIFSGLEEGQFRIIPEKEDHSLIWILWHISRIEDVTMSVLVAGGSQLYIRDKWKDKLRSPVHHVGNLINARDIQSLTGSVALEGLFDYRDAVGRQTRSIVSNLKVAELAQKVLPERLTQLVDEGAVLPEAESLLSYWGKRMIFELLLMPPTRHVLVHLNEARVLKERLLK